MLTLTQHQNRQYADYMASQESEEIDLESRGWEWIGKRKGQDVFKKSLGISKFTGKEKFLVMTEGEATKHEGGEWYE